MLLGKKVEDFDKDFIQSLIDDKYAESRTLDYKQKFDISGDQNRLEFLKDISSFYNTEGGVILFGLKEAKANGIKLGIPEPPESDWVVIADYDQTKSKIQASVRSGTNPHITGLRFSPLINMDGWHTFAIGIPMIIGCSLSVEVV